MGTAKLARGGALASGLCLMLVVTACSSGSGKVLVQSSQPPPIATSSSPTGAPAATASTPATHPKRHATAPTAPAASTAASSPAPATKPKPKPAPTKTVTRASACTTQGPTTTIKMVTGYRFSPSAVTINRCDAVKAVYADTGATPHNWIGPTWQSPDMSSSGQSYTYRFTSSGTFNFYCSYHRSLGMTGTVTVH